MTKERKMGVVNSAWGDFMAACNLLKKGESSREGGRRENERKAAVKKRSKDGNANSEESFGSISLHSQISLCSSMTPTEDLSEQGRRLSEED